MEVDPDGTSWWSNQSIDDTLTKSSSSDNPCRPIPSSSNFRCTGGGLCGRFGTVCWESTGTYCVLGKADISCGGFAPLPRSTLSGQDSGWWKIVEGTAVLIVLFSVFSTAGLRGRSEISCWIFEEPQRACCAFGTAGISSGGFPDPLSRPTICERDFRWSSIVLPEGTAVVVSSTLFVTTCWRFKFVSMLHVEKKVYK